MVRQIIDGGASILWSRAGAPTVARQEASSVEQWGFNADRLRWRGEQLQWPDKELLHFLEYGCYEYSSETPPVSWFAPHSGTVYAHWQTFVENVQQEIDDGWLKGAWPHPPAVSFRIVPGATIPKPRRPNAVRTIWNGSIPGPDCQRSAIDNGQGCVRLVATNAAARLPGALAMMWLSLERVSERLHVLAQVAQAAGERLSGRSRDFRAWFRMLRVTNTDLWKCCACFKGAFYRDERMQMGRVASAHTGQRTSQLIAAVLNKEVSDRTARLLDLGRLHAAKAELIRYRERRLGRWQAAVAVAQIFQDDLLEVAVGADM